MDSGQKIILINGIQDNSQWNLSKNLKFWWNEYFQFSQLKNPKKKNAEHKISEFKHIQITTTVLSLTQKDKKPFNTLILWVLNN